MQKKFRAYQAEASTAILKSWAAKQNSICVVATGGGKTLIAAGTAARIQQNGNPQRILFLANRNELCQQPLAVFRDQLGFAPALEKAEFQAPLDAKVVIASVQTLSRKKRLERFPADHFAYIFADECHMSVAASWKRIFDHFSSAKRCGITATPFRSDGKKLSDLFETEAYRKGLFDLVDDGYLVSPDNVERLSTAISLANVRVKHTTEGLDYDLQGAHDAIEPYFRSIAKELKEKFAQRHILAFLPLVASSQKFVAACVAEGLNAVHIDGEDPQREQKLQDFRDGKITLLSNASLLHTGVDIPACDCTLNLRPTRSKVLYQQVIGRSTRTEPGVIDGLETAEARLKAIAASRKPRSYVIDPLWLSEDHDLVTPSFLIAASQEEAEEMNQSAGKSYSLRQLQRNVQREREERIRRRLEATARFRENSVSAKYFAAGIGDAELLNYEPVYAWERAAVSRFSRTLLARDGIDPDTVTGEGEARAILQAMGRRKYKKLPAIRQLAGAHDAGVSAEELWTLTLKEASKYGW
jgi:superfamily II DNA or RNA helicase